MTKPRGHQKQVDYNSSYDAKLGFGDAKKKVREGLKSASTDGSRVAMLYEAGRARQAAGKQLEEDFAAGFKTRGIVEGGARIDTSTKTFTDGARTAMLFEDGNNKEWRRQEREAGRLAALAAAAASELIRELVPAAAGAAAERLYKGAFLENLRGCANFFFHPSHFFVWL